MNEFNFISNKTEYEKIYKLCFSADQETENIDKARLCREALDEIIKFLYEKEGKKYPTDATLLELIDNPFVHGFVGNDIIIKSLHFIRKLGMNAVHGLQVKKTHVKIAMNNLEFFVRFIDSKYNDTDKKKTVELPQYMNEAMTRKIYIDQYLGEVGWDVMPPNTYTTLANGKKVKSGSVFPSKACSEIPIKGMNNVSGIGFCDYVLYGKNGKPLAIIEAKKTSEEALVGYHQVKMYGECMKAEYGYVPILYYTNGYEIYVIDGLYPSRKVMAFHSMEELEYLLQKRFRNDTTDFRIDDGIAGRPYQKMAITNVCERFNEKYRRSLIVMATGTGKTRVSISLVDVLLRNKWIKNILFLADRKSLVRQAFNNFRKLLPNMSYCVLSDRKLANEPNARITFSTHQTMIRYIDAEQKEYTSAHFDLIIIDEAHRSVFNKYGAIFEYFDALLVGLTATPKDEVDASTYQLFRCENGQPNFVYSIEEAVKDKYLVPYRTESKTTKILNQGVKYRDLSEEDRRRVESVLLDSVDDNYVIPKELLFKLFYNKDTCAKILDELMTNGLRVDGGQKVGKTIIFAYNHKHADQIVKVFKDNYPSYGEDYCQLIDNKVKNADDLITQFEDNEDFRIAVSVDMLDTGIDVPSILNLVFFKPIRSKIKFVQMIGRGTRLCEGLIDGKDKKFFLIFDYCGNFEFFDEHPEGISITNGKSLSQKLFDVRLDILVELQSYEHQTNSIHKAYYDKLKNLLYDKVTDIKKAESRISVRQELKFVDKYQDFEVWESIAPLSKKEIQLHLSPLVDNDLEESKGALRFDMQMLQIELAVLASGGAENASKQVEKVRLISKLLLQNAAGKPLVMEKSESLNTLADTSFWSSPAIDVLEKCREDIRTLLEYLPHGPSPIDIDVQDEVMQGKYEGKSLLDIRTYREKVIDYLFEHTENTTIHKIKNVEPINTDDLKELERILWEELGTKDDYQQSTDIDNLAAFIRSIVGVDQEVINKKFGEFLDENIMNAQQQEFVKAVIDYVRENGDIQMEDLIEKAPFDNYDLLSLFGSNIIMIRSLVEQFHNSIIAA